MTDVSATKQQIGAFKQDAAEEFFARAKAMGVQIAEVDDRDAFQLDRQLRETEVYVGQVEHRTRRMAVGNNRPTL